VTALRAVAVAVNNSSSVRGFILRNICLVLLHIFLIGEADIASFRAF
jgi:hypothetical protein